MQRPLAGSPCCAQVADAEAEHHEARQGRRAGSRVEVAPDVPGLSCRSPVAYRAEKRRLRLIYVSGPAYTFEYAVIDEGQDAVIVGIVESAMPGAKRRVGIQRTAEVDLGQPLGGRNVVDARTGGTLPVAPNEM
jgi:hypothetical protein